MKEFSYYSNVRIPFPVSRMNSEKYKVAKARFRAEENRLYGEFKKDLFNHFEVNDYPKKTHAFNIAWEDAHSEGFEAVYDRFEVLVELIT